MTDFDWGLCFSGGYFANASPNVSPSLDAACVHIGVFSISNVRHVFGSLIEKSSSICKKENFNKDFSWGSLHLLCKQFSLRPQSLLGGGGGDGKLPHWGDPWPHSADNQNVRFFVANHGPFYWGGGRDNHYLPPPMLPLYVPLIMFSTSCGIFSKDKSR